jgi:hypothetical protein
VVVVVLVDALSFCDSNSSSSSVSKVIW